MPGPDQRPPPNERREPRTGKRHSPRLVVMILIQTEENEFGILKAVPGRSKFSASCGAVDRRDCTMMKHIILAEIRRSNAPAWVAEEVERKLNCSSCRAAITKVNSNSWQ
jgi:hypothetical protein